MVTCHGELREFFLDDEIRHVFLLRKFVSESEAVVIKPETQDHDPVRGFLAEGNSHFIVMVPDFGFFTPYGFPCLVESRVFRFFHFES